MPVWPKGGGDGEVPELVKYIVTAAVVHSGTSPNSGHYYAFAADRTAAFSDDAPVPWHLLNDSTVTATSFKALQALSIASSANKTNTFVNHTP